MNRDALELAYAKTVDGAGVVRLEGWTTLRVTGADRASFLHNMCTNDVRSLPPGGGCEAFFTDVKGKIVGHAAVLAGEDEIRVVTVPEQAEGLIRHLDRYIIREDVQLADASPDLEWLLVLGARAGELLAQCGGNVAAIGSPWSHAGGSLGGFSAQVVRCTLPWCGGYLAGTSPDAARLIHERLTQAGAVECPEDAWHAIRIESGWPLYGVDFTAANLPQEIGRDDYAISFRKGCYLGQETVARIDALGHVNRQLSLVQIAGETVPSVGTELLYGDRAAGRISSSSWSPRFKAPAALAIIHRGANEIGSWLRCDGCEAVVAGFAVAMRGGS